MDTHLQGTTMKEQPLGNFTLHYLTNLCINNNNFNWFMVTDESAYDDTSNLYKVWFSTQVMYEISIYFQLIFTLKSHAPNFQKSLMLSSDKSESYTHCSKL